MDLTKNWIENMIKSLEVCKLWFAQNSEFYDLELYNLKDIDKYLWQPEKEKFPKKYE